MKTSACIIVLMLLSQIVMCQNKGIEIEQLFITNKMNGKSVRLFSNEETLKDFGELITVKTLDQNIHSDDYAKEYIFADVVFYISTQGKISSFETASENIMIEKKGHFSISPGNSLFELTEFFPKETNNAKLILYGKSKEEYLCVKFDLSEFSKNLNKYVAIDYSLNLLYDVKTKVLVKAYIWIKP